MSTATVAQQALSDLEAYILRGGGAYSSWYCGIASNPRDRLFSAHQVDEKNGWWIFRDCGSDALARQVEAYFHRKGCKGDCGGGDGDTRFVYAYRITSTTREDC